MPAPQASMMQQFAKAKFAANGLRVPKDWQQPSGNPAGKQYVDAFKPSERSVAPDTAVPPLFMPASVNKYHVDTQKRMNKDFGKFIDDMCSAICGAWSQWQTATTMTGVMINAVTGSGGVIVGPPLTPLILASAPNSSPQLLKYSMAIAQTIGTAWLTYTASVKIPGLPLWPAFAAFPGPIAPPVPNVPVPFITLTQVDAGLQPSALKGQMVGALGDPKAAYADELFDCISDAFNKVFTIWKASTLVTNIMGTGPIPTFAPPFVPVGPVVGGVGNMIPGGLT